MVQMLSLLHLLIMPLVLEGDDFGFSGTIVGEESEKLLDDAFNITPLKSRILQRMLLM